MKLDEWLARLVAVPPGQSQLTYALAIGMRIALLILVPLGIIAAIAIALLHRYPTSVLPILPPKAIPTDSRSVALQLREPPLSRLGKSA
jgi:hypothetical protein